MAAIKAMRFSALTIGMRVVTTVLVVRSVLTLPLEADSKNECITK
jgi:hypothetical protein